MGSLRQKPLSDLIRSLRDSYDIATLIETGTHRGDSTSFAAEEFPRVITIEVRPDFQDIARTLCAQYDNIEFVLGDTREALTSVVDGLTQPAMFWLDAHSHMGGAFGDHDDCPILDELTVINRSPHHHVILIDDAHWLHWWFHWREPPRINWPLIPAIADKAVEGGYIMHVTEHDVILLV